MTVINTNVASLVTQNAMSINERVVNRNMAKLSTGLRINSSADDAAGLAIVSNMTSKIQGLDMAVRNANDAISMIQTAEGALGEMVNMVQRMRELAVQSSNATLTNEQRGFLNLEFQELKNEIDRTAKSTDWNGKKILNQDQSTNGNYSFQVGSQSGQTIDIDIPNFTIDGISRTVPLPISKGSLDLTEKYSNIPLNRGPGTYDITESWLGSSLLVNYNQKDYQITLPLISTGLVSIKKLDNGSWTEISTSSYNSNEQFALAEALAEALKKIPEVNNNFNITTDTWLRINTSNSNTLGEKISFQVSRAEGKQSELRLIWSSAKTQDENKSNGEYYFSGDWAGSSLLVKYNQKDYKITLPLLGKELVNIQKLENGNWISINSSPYNSSIRTMLFEGLKKIPEFNDSFDLSENNTSSIGIKPSNSNTLGNQILLSVDRLDGNQPNLTYYNNGGVYTKIEQNIKPKGSFNTGDSISINVFDKVFQYTITDQDILSSNQTKSILTNLSLQISNANVQGLNIVTSDTNLVLKSTDNRTDLNFSTNIIRNQNPTKTIINATSQINSSSLDTVINSNSAISSVDIVLNNINAARSNFGAKINRLSYTIDNLSNVSMNLTASRSRIQDTDYAKAMSDLAKAQIIQQASTAMLAQANSSKQYVLKLLQS